MQDLKNLKCLLSDIGDDSISYLEPIEILSKEAIGEYFYLQLKKNR
jgi:hypothetical protein